jgi:chemotaxis protein CheD
VNVITIGISDCRVSGESAALLVTHALGSCIAVVIHDPVARVGGMLHFMLPEGGIDQERAQQRPFMFADTGIPKLFQLAYALGADKKRISVRLIGGAQVADPNGVFNIGKRNYLACRKILWSAGVMIHGEVVGGSISRSVKLEVGSGQLWWNTGGGEMQELRVTGKGN